MITIKIFIYDTDGNSGTRFFPVAVFDLKGCMGFVYIGPFQAPLPLKLGICKMPAGAGGAGHGEA